MDKNYLTIAEQIEYLKEHKHLTDDELIKKSLNDISYINLITPYSRLIAIDKVDEKYVYEENLSFAKYIECSRIDDGISCCLRSYIGRLEKRLKSFIADYYSNKMKMNGDLCAKNFSWIDSYLKGNSELDLLLLFVVHKSGTYDSASDEVAENRKKVLEEIKNFVGSKNFDNYLCNHWLTKYGYVPMYVIVQKLSLNSLITLFCMIDYKDKECFVGELLNKDKRRVTYEEICQIEKNLSQIRIIRNIVNHYEPIIPFILDKTDQTFPAFKTIVSHLKNYYDRSELCCNINIVGLDFISFDKSSLTSKNINRINSIISIIK